METLNVSTVRKLTCDWFLPLVKSVSGRPATIMVKEHSEEGGNCQFPERFLQALWNEQRLRFPLETVDGRSLRVISAGTWNVSAGPDFRNAALELDGELLRGDIEVHRRVADWHAHGHTGDPAYGAVILHVVWETGATSGGSGLPPTFELSGHVNAGLDALQKDLDCDLYPYGRKVGPGRCAGPLSTLGDGDLREMFRAAGLARFARKSESLVQQICKIGSDQAVYEGFMSALGYHRNKAAFRSLCAHVPMDLLQGFKHDSEREACLWGAAGFLPDPTSVPVTPDLRPLTMRWWRCWWETGLPPADIAWHRAGCRPLNSPERRLAAGCAWLKKCHFRPQEYLLRVGLSAPDGQSLRNLLETELNVDDPWKEHISFTHRLRRPANLLGQNRRRDIIVNVFLPFLHALGTLRSEPDLVSLAEEAWLGSPRLQGNRAITEAVHRFLYPPSRADKVVNRACEQQGVLEMYHSLCKPWGGACEACPLTSVVPDTEVVKSHF